MRHDSPPAKGVARVLIEREEAGPDSGMGVMQSLNSVSGFAAAYRIEVHDMEGKSTSLHTLEEANALATIDVALDVIKYGMSLDQVEARMKEAMSGKPAGGN